MSQEIDCKVLALLDSIDLPKVGKYPKLLKDYVSRKAELQDFYKEFPTSVQDFANHAAAKPVLSLEHRMALKSLILKQYEGIDLNEAVQKQIDCIVDENTFTVTTGHQLVLYTGPLYFIYKIATVVVLAREIEMQYPDLHVVPVYWMATEDHDYEEISELSVFGKKTKWESDECGSVGQYDPKSVADLFSEVNGFPDSWAACYRDSETLAEATRKLVDLLFGVYGVVVLDGADHAAKQFGKSLFVKEIEEQFSFPAVVSRTEELEAVGYSSQIFPRELNLFYMEKGLRERILYEEGIYSVKNTDLRFSRDELLEIVETSPEKISPNVVLRPVYQEMLLPNLAYIGGPAEIAYWLQLGKVFDLMEKSMPLLVPRHFALILNGKSWERWQKSGLDVMDLFKTEQELREHLLAAADTDAPADWLMLEAMLKNAFEQAADYAKMYDSSLVGMVQAEMAKSIKGLENIEKRTSKAREQKFATEVNQVMKVYQRLFPEGGLQERGDSILSFLPDCEMMIECLIQQMKPLDYRFHIWKIA
jgi:bacillithiol biosynthesis cysteine-adding enzyme BshC